MGASHLKSGRSRMRGNNLSYEIFRGVNCGGFFFFMRLVSRPLPVSFLAFLGYGRILSRRLIFLNRLACDHDHLGYCPPMLSICLPACTTLPLLLAGLEIASGKRKSIARSFS